MIKTNKSALVDISVGGEIVSPEWSGGLYQVDETGRTFILPGAGGTNSGSIPVILKSILFSENSTISKVYWVNGFKIKLPVIF